MDLKIKDVAELLNVSETTVRRWIKSRKIPAYQLYHQYRFSSAEIEDWMMRCKLNLAQDGFSPFEQKQTLAEGDDAIHQRNGTQQFSFYRAMYKGGVIHDIGAKNKEQLMRSVMERAAPRLGLDPVVMAELLLDREELMPTALNMGIAVPHPRDVVLEIPGSDAIITVFLQQPLEFGALDGQPVHTLFFLFSASDKTHLHLLSKIAHLSSQPTSIDFLATRPTQEALLAFVKEWEATIRSASYSEVG